MRKPQRSDHAQPVADCTNATAVSPIARYRMHEALARLEAGRPIDLAALAADLGYFDQAHFNRDFRRLVGYAPGRYGR